MTLPEFKQLNYAPRRCQTLVIVPVYNEMPHLTKVIASIREYFKGDILAVDDCSNDGSTEALMQLNEISVIRNDKNAGAGGVLLQAFSWATEKGYSNVITMDADGQHSPESIKCFLHQLEVCRRECECDFVWGSRYLSGEQQVKPEFSHRRKINRLITSRLNEVTGYQLTDAFCGFRAYRLEALNKLDITEHGYGMFMQMTLLAKAARLTIHEIPVPLIYLDDTRDFNGNFSDWPSRLAYYNQIIDQTLTTNT